MRAGSGLELDFAFRSLQPGGRFKFTPVDGPGVSGFEPDVTGCDFIFLRLEIFGGGLVVVEDIVDSPTWGRGRAKSFGNLIENLGNAIRRQ
jgi:hypothetical protein